MDILKWLKDIINPMAQSKDINHSELKSDNSIEQTEEVIEKIVATLRRAGEVKNLFGICLWVNDDVLHTTLFEEGFDYKLKQAFDNANLTQFGSSNIELRTDLPAFGATEVIGGKLFVSILTEDNKPNDFVIIEISCVEDTGSLAKKRYVLDSLIKTTFHIGRGKTCNRDGLYRTNDVVIKDDEWNSDIASKNSHVSGSQANIVVEKGGTYLQAMRSGCRTEGGSSTVIVHDQSAVELRDTKTLYPLHDGDMIELGKNVLLTVKIHAKHYSKDTEAKAYV